MDTVLSQNWGGDRDPERGSGSTPPREKVARKALIS